MKKRLKILKDYGSWVLVQHPEGFKEGIHKQEMGLVKKRKKQLEPRLKGITGIKV